MKENLKKLSILVVLLLSVIFLTAGTAAAEEPQYGGTLTITDFSFSSARTLDPHTAQCAL